MKAKVNLELKPFAVPESVEIDLKGMVKREDEDYVPEAELPLAALDSCDLNRLCEDFVAEVFKKAGKERPPKQA